MKTVDLEYNLIKATPAGSPTDTTFTQHVMRGIMSPSLESAVGKEAHETNKKSRLFRLRHLPKFAVALLALAFLLTVSGVTYAVVETIKQQSQVKLEASGVNEHGRQQLSVTFDSCAEQKKNGTMYELKKDSGLSAEDGAKVLQAQCERDSVVAWLQKDLANMEQTPDITTNPNSFFGRLRTDGFVGTFRGMNETGISLHSDSAYGADSQDQTSPFPKNARVVEAGKIVDQAALQPGNTVLYFSPRSYAKNPPTTDFTNVTVFKLNLEAKYYSLDMQSYVRARQPCQNNPTRSCIVSNNINTVILEVGRGGASIDIGDRLANKVIQGRVVSWSNREIKLDVGKGVIYTFQTNVNVIDTYNQTTVYGLKAYDSVYANNDPEDLKIAVGDSLEIDYQEPADQSAQVIPWSQIQGFRLMVEREVNNLNVLRKY